MIENIQGLHLCSVSLYKKGCKGMKNRRHFFLIAPCIFHCLTVKTDKCDVGSLISNQNDSLAVYKIKW
jgi:hypothetical protein